MPVQLGTILRLNDLPYVPILGSGDLYHLEETRPFQSLNSQAPTQELLLACPCHQRSIRL